MWYVVAALGGAIVAVVLLLVLLELAWRGWAPPWWR